MGVLGNGAFAVCFLMAVGCATTQAPVTTTTVATAAAPPAAAPPAPAPATATVAPRQEPPPTREAALEDVRAYANRAGAAGPDEAAAQALLRDSLRRWGDWSAAWIEADRRADADALFQAIAEVNGQLRERGVELRPRGIRREVFTLGEHRVEGWEWSEPVRYYPNSDMMMRWITFWVFEGENTVARMDLEYSNMAGPYFVLGAATSEGHSQLVAYNDQHPDYWTVREAALRTLRGERRDPIASSSGNAEGRLTPRPSVPVGGAPNRAPGRPPR